MDLGVTEEKKNTIREIKTHSSQTIQHLKTLFVQQEPTWD